MRVLPALPLPRFGTSVRTVPVRHAAPSSFLAYYPVTQPVPTDESQPIDPFQDRCEQPPRQRPPRPSGTSRLNTGGIVAIVAMVEPTSERNEEGGIAV